MKARAIVPLVIGLGVGLIAIKLVVDVVQRAKGSGTDANAVPVVIAKTEIPVGMAVTPDMVKVSKASKGGLPSRYYDTAEEVTGRVARYTMLPGVVVQPTMLAPEGTVPGLGVKIPDGYRAVAVKVDEFSSVGGFLKPGSRVDVIAVLNVKKNRKTETITKIILQNIEVAAVGQQLDDQSDSNSNNALSRSVTLLVRPKEASELHLAATKGNIRLAMRSYKDQVATKAEDATESKLFGQEEEEVSAPLQPGFFSTLFASMKAAGSDNSSGPTFAAAMAPPKPDPWCVKLMKGDEVEEITFAAADSWVRTNSTAGQTGLTPTRMPMSHTDNQSRYGNQSAPQADPEDAADGEDDVEEFEETTDDGPPIE